MAITYAVDPSTGVVRSRATGVVTPDQLRAHVQALAEDPALERPLREIWDGRAVERFELSAAQIRGVIDLADLLRRRLGNAHVAVVSNDDLVYGLGRVAQIAAELASFRFHPFRRMEDAERWMAAQASTTEASAQGRPAD